MPSSSSGLGHLVLSQETGVRFPVGVLDSTTLAVVANSATGLSNGQACCMRRAVFVRACSYPEPLPRILQWGGLLRIDHPHVGDHPR